jgi:hypothetical protein
MMTSPCYRVCVLTLYSSAVCGNLCLDLPQDEDRLQTATNEAPTLDWFNKQLARGHAEYELFTRLDKEAHWPGELYTPQEVR